MNHETSDPTTTVGWNGDPVALSNSNNVCAHSVKLVLNRTLRLRLLLVSIGRLLSSFQKTEIKTKRGIETTRM
jgi:hypothetical protein